MFLRLALNLLVPFKYSVFNIFRKKSNLMWKWVQDLFIYFLYFSYVFILEKRVLFKTPSGPPGGILAPISLDTAWKTPSLEDEWSTVPPVGTSNNLPPLGSKLPPLGKPSLDDDWKSKEGKITVYKVEVHVKCFDRMQRCGWNTKIWKNMVLPSQEFKKFYVFHQKVWCTCVYQLPDNRNRHPKLTNVNFFE